MTWDAKKHAAARTLLPVLGEYDENGNFVMKVLGDEE